MNYEVPLDGFTMQLRPSEVAAVAVGAGSTAADLIQGLCDLQTYDRAALWELAVRHYGRRKPLEQAAGEIGMDVVHARALLEALAVQNR